jgi:hypothetical protein
MPQQCNVFILILGALPVYEDLVMPRWTVRRQWGWLTTCFKGSYVGTLLSITPHWCPLLLPPYHILSFSWTPNSLPPKTAPPSISPLDAPSILYLFVNWLTNVYSSVLYLLFRNALLSSIFEWIPHSRVEVIYFSECAFVIDDLDCMTLLGNIHILCIISSQLRLNGTKFLEPYETSRLQL